MKTLLFALMMVLGFGLQAQTTATNFNCNDCQGNPHDLFTELDAGIVVVLDWAMPCGSCVGPSLTAYNVVQSYASSHPGRVRFYVADDFADNSCNSITSWTTSNNMPGTTTFSNSIIDMSDYGSYGMPKIVVLGRQSHKIFYNVNGTGGTSGALIAAIDSALYNAVGISDAVQPGFRILPMPVQDVLRIEVSFPATAVAEWSLVDLQGKKVADLGSNDLNGSTSILSFPVDFLPTGLYLLEMKVEDEVYRQKLVKE